MAIRILKNKSAAKNNRRLFFVLGLLCVAIILVAAQILSINHTIRVVDQVSGGPLTDVYVKLFYSRSTPFRLHGSSHRGCIGEKPMQIVKTDTNGEFRAPTPEMPWRKRIGMVINPNDNVMIGAWLFKPGHYLISEKPIGKWGGIADRYSYRYGHAPYRLYLKNMNLDKTIEIEYLADMHRRFSQRCGDLDLLPELHSEINPIMRDRVKILYEAWRETIVARGESPEENLSMMGFLRRVNFDIKSPEGENGSE